ncbi:acyl-CoA dehydratase activase [Lachnospiraceae bacterium ZAX-1]
MKNSFIGIDSGSTMCKSVLFLGNSVIDKSIIKTGWNPKKSALYSVETLLKRNGLKQEDVTVSATGYGRETIDVAKCTFTEITCHALGGTFLNPNIQAIVDIGGQDSKIIKIENGKAVDFFMNDKCAAGTGRFLTMACNTLEIDIDDIDTIADIEHASSINSMCAVFAESEIIGLLAAQVKRSCIIAGVLKSIGTKMLQMLYKLKLSDNEPILLTGGLSRSKILVDIISNMSGYEVLTHDLSVFAGAIGACICADRQGM